SAQVSSGITNINLDASSATGITSINTAGLTYDTGTNPTTTIIANNMQNNDFVFTISNTTFINNRVNIIEENQVNHEDTLDFSGLQINDLNINTSVLDDGIDIQTSYDVQTQD